MDVKNVTLCGKHYGARYQLPDGRSLFLRHCTGRDLKEACVRIDWQTAVRLLDANVDAMGFVIRKGKRRFYFLSPAEDYRRKFLPKKFNTRTGGLEAVIPLRWFKVRPDIDFEILDAITTIRK